MSTRESFYDNSERFLGKTVGSLIPILGKTACMSQDYRELYVILEHAFKLGSIYNIDKEALDILRNIILPLLCDLGRADFQRDILTSLSFAMSQKPETRIREKRKSKDKMTLANLFKKNPK